ncbi:MFS transporter [Streptococcus sp. S784/96/1]|uniref:MFS transporter n=1 Tax=Streptococcus sp. S784/96/1 TaxID=2653499 RepID=UPI0013876796|nr:MFS transporter [Streptococcus sp. S784/96/1]
MEKKRTHDNSDATLSMKERIGYGVGDFASNMMFAPVNSFITYFYTNIVGLGAGVVGTIMLLARLLDGLSDVLVGYLMEKIHSKHGKARPWILWWSIPFAISLVLLFSVPNLGTTGKTIYAAATYILAIVVVFTAANLPFGTLGSLITKNQTERGYLNISKMIFAFAGGLVVNMLTLPMVEYFGNDARAWQLTFLIYGGVATVLFWITFFTTKERVTEEALEKNKKERVDLMKGLASLFKNKYWLILLAVFFLNSVVNAFLGVNVYYAQYIMNDTGLVGNLSLYQTIASFATFAASAYLLKRWGKKKIALYGFLASLIGYGMVVFAPTSYPILYISAFIKGVGNAAQAGVAYGMLADTVEYNDYKFGMRIEGLVFSASSFGSKVGSGIGSALLGWILAAFGYVSSSATQPALAITGIKVIFLYVPIVFFALMVLIMYFYDLDDKYDDIIAKLALRDKEN